MKTALIIGAGGTGSLLVGAITQSFDVIIADGDTYEDKNKTRQPLTATGKNKANVVADVFGKNKSVEPIPHYLMGGEGIETDIVLSCVDSNEGRNAARQIAMKNECPAIFMQNEAWNPMAFLYLPQYDNTFLCPFTRYSLDKLESSREFTCGGIQVDEDEGGQSGLANLAAAGLGVMILHSLSQNNEDNYIMEAKNIPWTVWKKLKDVRQETLNQ